MPKIDFEVDLQIVLHVVIVVIVKAELFYCDSVVLLLLSKVRSHVKVSMIFRWIQPYICTVIPRYIALHLLRLLYFADFS